MLPIELVTLLKNPNIIKVGLNVKGDITRLGKDFASQLFMKEEFIIPVPVPVPPEDTIQPSLTPPEVGLDSPIEIILNIPIDASPYGHSSTPCTPSHTLNQTHIPNEIESQSQDQGSGECTTTNNDINNANKGTNIGIGLVGVDNRRGIDMCKNNDENKNNENSVSTQNASVSVVKSVSVVSSVCDLRHVGKSLELACNQDNRRRHICWPTKGSLDDVVHKLSCYRNQPLTLPKPTQIRRGNWEFKPLGREQLMYAALDAYASWFAFKQMKELFLSPPIPPIHTPQAVNENDDVSLQTQLLSTELDSTGRNTTNTNTNSSTTATTSSITSINIPTSDAGGVDIGIGIGSDVVNFDIIIRNCAANQDNVTSNK